MIELLKHPEISVIQRSHYLLNLFFRRCDDYCFAVLCRKNLQLVQFRRIYTIAIVHILLIECVLLC